MGKSAWHYGNALTFTKIIITTQILVFHKISLSLTCAYLCLKNIKESHFNTSLCLSGWSSYFRSMSLSKSQKVYGTITAKDSYFIAYVCATQTSSVCRSLHELFLIHPSNVFLRQKLTILHKWPNHFAINGLLFSQSTSWYLLRISLFYWADFIRWPTRANKAELYS